MSTRENIRLIARAPLLIAWTAFKLANTEFSPDYCNRNNSLSILNII